MDEIKQKLGFDASNALKNLAQLDGAMAQFEKRLSSSAAAMRTFGLTGEQLDKLGKNFQSTTPEITRNVDRMTTSLKLLSRVVFTQLIVRALSQLRNAFRSAAGDAIAFQKQIALITTIDDSAQSVEQLSANVRAVSEQFNLPLLEAAAGLYQTISNQIGSAAESQEFLAKSAQFARATGSDLKNSVDLLSGALKSYGLDVSETDRVSSIFFKTIDLGRVEANELANSFGRVGPIAAELGISLEETGAALAAITVRGSKTSEALTQVRAITSALQKPTAELAKALRDEGFTSAEAALKTLGLTGVLDLLAKSTAGSAEAMAKLFPNVRGLAGAATLTGDDLKSLSAGIQEMTTASANFTSQKFLQATATDAEKLTAEINKLKNAFTIDFGQAVVKAGVSLADFVGGADAVVDVTKAAGPAILGVAGAFTVARLQIAAARSELTLLAKGLGALSLIPLAIGAGTSLGELIGDQLTKRDREVLDALEAQHTAELKLVEARLKKQRDLEDNADAERVKAARQVFQLLNKEYLRDFDNQRDANSALVDNTKANLAKILSARTSFVDELARAAARADDTIRNSAERVTGLNDVKADRDFAKRTDSLSDAQKAIALGRRAQEFADSATKQLLLAGKIGDSDGLKRALALFDRAQKTGESSREIADRIGDRNLESRAMRQLVTFTDQQISAEERLAKIVKASAAAKDVERAKQQGIVDLVRAQAKIIQDNTSIFDDSGNQLNDADLAKRAAARQAAFKKLTNAALSQSDLTAAGALGIADFISRFEGELSRDPLTLSINTEKMVTDIQSGLDKAFREFANRSGINVSGLEQVLGRQFTSPDQISQGLDEAAKKAATLRLEISKALSVAPQKDAIKAEIQQLLTEIQSGRTSGALFGGDDDRAKFVETENALREITSAATFTDEQLGEVIRKRDELRKQVIGDQNPVAALFRSGEAAFGDEIVKIDGILTRLQQLSALPTADVSGKEAQLQQLENVLKSNPAGQFQAASTAIGTAATFSERVAAGWERAAVASQRVGIGGGVAHFANGGRGTDTIPAMLTAGESVINAKSSRRFFSQIQAMNAGHAPIFRSDGGSVDNSVHLGDVTVSGEQAVNIRKLAAEINRSTRRGASRIN